MNFPPRPTLAHTVNSSGRLGMFVNPHSCPCDGCRDFLAGATGVEEPPGLSNLAPPSALNLERQTAVPRNSSEGSPVFSPLSHTSSLAPTDTAPIALWERLNASLRASSEGPPVFTPLSHTSSTGPLPLPQRSNGGGIPFGALAPTPTGLGNWRAAFEGFRESRWEPEPEPEAHSSLCHCGPCIGEHENTGMPLQLRDEIVGHLTTYLTMLEKHQKVMAAKMDLYAFLLEDASVRLRLDTFNKKIKELKETLAKLE